MSLHLALRVLFAPALFIVAVMAEQRCHVCVPGKSDAVEVMELFPSSTLLPCHQSTQIKVCPDKFNGCLTETTRGGQVTRTCGQLPVNICKAANDVEYCYCTGDLCNAPPVSGITVTDDEDLAEGSGMDVQTPQTTAPPTTSSTTTTTTTIPPLRSNPNISSATHLRHSATLCSTILVFVYVWR